MAKKVILVRHGVLGSECQGRYVGRTDAPLSAEGRRQAAALAPEYRRWSGARCLCSPLARCRETAAIALGSDGRYEIDADLREIDFGRWEGMTFADIVAQDPADVDRWAALEADFAFPEGEGLSAFEERISALAERIAADSAETVVAVTHRGVIRFLICRLLGLESRHHLLFDIQPCSVTEIRMADGHGVLALLNDRHHLHLHEETEETGGVLSKSGTQQCRQR